jgi:hypothetical protein
MSKLYDLMEAYKVVSEMCEYRKIVETTMKDALRALKTDPDSEELLGIYYFAKLDYERADMLYKELKAEYDELYKKSKKDVDFLEQLKYTTDVPEEYRHILAALRSDAGIAVGFEMGNE